MKTKLLSLSDTELLSETRVAAKNEKSATMALLEYLSEVDARHAYAIGPYSSLFEYLVRGLGYSESQASERVNAVRLMRQEPSTKAHLESGSMSLSTAAQVQRFLLQEKRLNAPLSTEARSRLIDRCLHRSKREVESILLGVSSKPVRIAAMERTRQVTSELTEVRVHLNLEQSALLTRARELFPDDTLAALMARSLSLLIQRTEHRMGRTPPETKPERSDIQVSPLGKLNEREADAPPTCNVASTLHPVPNKLRCDLPRGKEPVTHASRYIPRKIKRLIYSRSGGQCEWRSPDTHERCRSRSRLQVDHITPLAVGGKTESRNLRHLCANHNTRAAMEWGIAKQGEVASGENHECQKNGPDSPEKH